MANMRLQAIRSGVIGLVLVALCGSAPAATQLQWKLPKGKTYYQRTIDTRNTAQSAMGQEQRTEEVTGLGLKLQVLDVDAQGNMQIQYTYLWTRIKRTDPMTQVTVDYDSSRQTAVPAGAESFAALIGQSYTIKMTPNGKILNVSGIEQVKEAVLKKTPAGTDVNSVMEPTAAYANKESVRQMTEARMAVYPDKPVNPGDAWSRDMTMVVGFTIAMKPKWTLQKVEAGIATIGSTVAVRFDPSKSLEIYGMKLSFDLSGTQEGTAQVAEATGLITSNKWHGQLKGEIKAGAPVEGQPAMAIPMTIDAEVTEEMSEQMWKTGP